MLVPGRDENGHASGTIFAFSWSSSSITNGATAGVTANGTASAISTS
jgi:hypothetical protein